MTKEIHQISQLSPGRISRENMSDKLNMSKILMERRWKQESHFF